MSTFVQLQRKEEQLRLEKHQCMKSANKKNLPPFCARMEAGSSSFRMTALIISIVEKSRMDNYKPGSHSVPLCHNILCERDSAILNAEDCVVTP